MSLCRSIFAEKIPTLITHSMPTNSQIDEKIVNSKRALRLLANIQRKLRRLFFARCINVSCAHLEAAGSFVRPPRSNNSLISKSACLFGARISEMLLGLSFVS